MDHPDVSASDVGSAHQLVNDHLKAYDAGKRYACSDNAPSKEEGLITNDKEEDSSQAITKYTSVSLAAPSCPSPSPRHTLCRTSSVALAGGACRWRLSVA